MVGVVSDIVPVAGICSRCSICSTCSRCRTCHIISCSYIYCIFYLSCDIWYNSGTTYADESHCYKHNAYFYAIRKGIGIFCASGFYARVPVRLQLSLHGFHKSRLPRCLWTIRGYTSLLVLGHDAPQDITKFMYVSLNPGPDLTGGWLLHDRFSTSQVVVSHTNSPSLTMKYSGKFLRSLRSSACTSCPQVLGELKLHGACSRPKRSELYPILE